MYTMGISLPLKNAHVLMRKALNKTKTNIFSTVGPWGLFRPFLLLRARKADIRREPSSMCCVREVTPTHLGVEISVTQKVRKFKFPQPLKPHSPAWIQNNWVFHSMTTCPAMASRFLSSRGWSQALHSGLKTDNCAQNLPQISLLQGS